VPISKKEEEVKEKTDNIPQNQPNEKTVDVPLPTSTQLAPVPSPSGNRNLNPTMGTENIPPFDKIPLLDADSGKDLLGRSPLNSAFHPQVMSPLGLTGCKIPFGSPNAQSVIRTPFMPGIAGNASNCNAFIGSPMNIPHNFAGYAEFASFANVTPSNQITSQNSKLFGSGSTSPCFPNFLSTMNLPPLDTMAKPDEKDN